MLSKATRLATVARPNVNQLSRLGALKKQTAPRLLVRAISSSSQSQESNQKSISFAILAGGLAGALGLVAWNSFNSDPLFGKEKEQHEQTSGFVKSGHLRPELPTYTEEQVKEHNKSAKTIWVSYKEGVYDITEFIKAHPGGPEKISMAAGSSIEPYWSVYPVHYKHETFALLEKHRIGNLKIDPNKVLAKDANDPFANDPKRHPSLKVLTAKPFNAETPKELSVDSLVTPNSLHFVRNHLPVPDIDGKSFQLEIVNEITSEKFTFTLDDLKSKFQVHTIPVTIQCSGNKRSLMSKHEPTQGLAWDVNAISNAEWTGVYLRDVLAHCRVNFQEDKIKHVQFEGLDRDPTGTTYGASIPKEKAFNPSGDVLLAFKMNGVDLPRDFGYPLRAVVPGVTGARSVKWLGKVVLSANESSSHWQVSDYKILPPSIKDLKQADFSKYRAVQESPVQSAICQPKDGDLVDREDGTITVRGFAFSGGGNSIDKVLVSVDDGKTWKSADINQAQAPLYRCWSWAIWECEMEIPKGGQEKIEIVCAASDSQQNTQPENVKSIWNARGLLNNSWHRVNIQLK